MRATNIFFFLLFFILSHVRAAEVVSLDLGLVDPELACSGGVRFDLSGVPADFAYKTLRYSRTVNGVAQPFTCTIDAEAGVPYVVTLTFVEPSATGSGQRSFSVSMNGRTVVDHVDLFKLRGAAKVPVERQFLDMPVDGKFAFTFTTHIRSAVASRIRAVPLSQLVSSGGTTTGPAGPTFQLTHVVGTVMQLVGGSYRIAQNAGESIVNVNVFRNGILQSRSPTMTSMADYLVVDVAGAPDALAAQPVNLWSLEDVVMAEYDILTFPQRAVIPWCYANVRPGAGWAANGTMTCEELHQLPIAVLEWRSCKSGEVIAGPVGDGWPLGVQWPPGVLVPQPPGWSCDGLQMYKFRLPGGATDGPYVAVKMPADFIANPTYWVSR